MKSTSILIPHKNSRTGGKIPAFKILRPGDLPAFLFSGLLLSFMFFLSFTSFLAAPCSAAVISGDTHLDVTVAEISPNPARPGEDLLIKINIENTGDEAAQNIRIGIEDRYPFEFRYSTSKEYGSGTNTEKFFEIEQLRQRSKVELNFHFRVDSRAVSGVQELEFTIMDGEETDFSEKIPVRVEGNPDPVLTGTKIIPADENFSADALVPGQAFRLLTTVKNAGNGDAKNVRVRLDLNASSPLVSLEDNVRFLEELEAGSSKNLSFYLLLGSNADVQPYKIPLKITASNEAETMQIDRVQEIGFNVLHKAEINIASLKFDPELPVRGEKVSIIIRLENVGEGEARFVKARLERPGGSGSGSSSGSGSGTGIPAAFLGRLEKDDDAPAVFTFVPEKAGEEEVILLVEYEDDFGKHRLTESLNFSVSRDSKNPGPLLFGALVLLAVAVFFMKKKASGKGTGKL